MKNTLEQTKTPAQQETRTVCPNCGQWQNPHVLGGADCVNECVGRGLAKPRTTVGSEVKRVFADELAAAPATPQHSPSPDCGPVEGANYTNDVPLAKTSLCYPLPWRNNGGQIESEHGFPQVIATVGKVNEQTHRDTAHARLIVRAVNNADKLATELEQFKALSVKIGDESAIVVNERDAARALNAKLATACRLWHKASLTSEGSKAQADLSNQAALASRAALAAYDAQSGIASHPTGQASKGGKHV